LGVGLSQFLDLYLRRSCLFEGVVGEEDSADIAAEVDRFVRCNMGREMVAAVEVAGMVGVDCIGLESFDSFLLEL
jgi:hypothetical protein